MLTDCQFLQEIESETLDHLRGLKTRYDILVTRLLWKWPVYLHKAQGSHHNEFERVERISKDICKILAVARIHTNNEVFTKWRLCKPLHV